MLLTESLIFIPIAWVRIMRTTSFYHCFSMTALSLILCLFSSGALAQRCDKTISLTTPTAQFSSSDSGAVFDSATSLMWQRCYVGQSFNSASNSCEGSPSTMSWQDVLQVARSENAAGYADLSDWRLPTIEELSSIIEEACYGSAINLAVFPGAGHSEVWAVFADAKLGYDGQLVNFYLIDFLNGNINYLPRSRHGAVRLVRKGS